MHYQNVKFTYSKKNMVFYLQVWNIYSSAFVDEGFGSEEQIYSG
jgi:hypothetical protein